MTALIHPSMLIGPHDTIVLARDGCTITPGSARQAAIDATRRWRARRRRHVAAEVTGPIIITATLITLAVLVAHRLDAAAPAVGLAMAPLLLLLAIPAGRRAARTFTAFVQPRPEGALLHLRAEEAARLAGRLTPDARDRLLDAGGEHELERIASRRPGRRRLPVRRVER